MSMHEYTNTVQRAEKYDKNNTRRTSLRLHPLFRISNKIINQAN